MVKVIAEYLGLGVVAIAVLSLITGFFYWLFKKTVEGWLKTKFDERLEEFKHGKVKELERLKFQISGLVDRTAKRQAQEFEVLPTLWTRLVMADSYIASTVAAFQSYPDISRMTPQQLEEFLQKSQLEGWQKDELRNAADKNKYYMRAYDFQKADGARARHRKFARYLRRRGIFIKPELKAKFSKVMLLLNDTLFDYEFNLQHPNSNVVDRNKSTETRKEINALMDEIESEVHATLWDSAIKEDNKLLRSSPCDPATDPVA